MYENKGRAGRYNQRYVNAYKEIIFSADIPTYATFLTELRRHQAIDEYIYDRKLMKDTLRKLTWEGLQKYIAMDDETMIDKRTGEVLNLEVDSTYYKNKF